MKTVDGGRVKSEKVTHIEILHVAGKSLKSQREKKLISILHDSLKVKQLSQIEWISSHNRKN